MSPTAQRVVGAVVLFVTGVNAAFGFLSGFLYWRWGLEAAMIAHGMAHVVKELMARL